MESTTISCYVNRDFVFSSGVKYRVGISSHILLELAQLCDKVGIIEQGRLAFTGTVDEILERARVGKVLHVGVADRANDAVHLLQQMTGVVEAKVQDHSSQHIRVMLDTDQGDPSAVAHKLVIEGFSLTRLEEETVSLETAFMRLTKGLVQ